MYKRFRDYFSDKKLSRLRRLISPSQDTDAGNDNGKSVRIARIATFRVRREGM